MSRNRTSVQYEDVAIDIVCPRGHRVGMVLKHGMAHPRAGTTSTWRGVRFEEAPVPSARSGRIRGACPRCRADAQVGWGRVLDKLDELDESGRSRGELVG